MTPEIPVLNLGFVDQLQVLHNEEIKTLEDSFVEREHRVEAQFDQRIHEQTEQVWCEVVAALHQYIQLLMSDSSVNTPLELALLEQRFTAPLHTEITTLKQELATLKVQQSQSLKLNNDSDIEDAFKERDVLRRLVATLQCLLQELVNYFGQCEEELNSSLVEGLNTTDKVHFAPDVSELMSFLHDSSIGDTSRDVSVNFRGELDRCLERLRMESATILGLSRKLREAEGRKEVVNEGFGESIQPIAQGMRVVLNDPSSPHLKIIEELCQEGDRISEEARKEKEDLQQQVWVDPPPSTCDASKRKVEVADKQLRSTRKFLEEQAAEREVEREEFLRELTILQDQLRERDRERELYLAQIKEVEALDQQLKESAAILVETEARRDQIQADLDAALDKISTLREIIVELEATVEDKAVSEEALKQQLVTLRDLLQQQSDSHRELAQELSSLRLDSGSLELQQHITHLEEQLRKHRLHVEHFHSESKGGVSAVRQMRDQLRELEVALERKTKELEALHCMAVSGSSAVSSPSEDVSIREHLDALRCTTPISDICHRDSHSPVSLPLEELSRLQDKLQRHSRAEEAALKRVRDLHMELKIAHRNMKEVCAERDVLQEQTEEQLLKVSALQARLDDQRRAVGAAQSEALVELQGSLRDKQEEIGILTDALERTSKQVSELQRLLEQMRHQEAIQEAEWVEALSKLRATAANNKNTLASVSQEEPKLQGLPLRAAGGIGLTFYKMTFINKRIRLFEDGDKAGILVRKRSEGRLKEYESATDIRSWCLNTEDHRRYLLELARLTPATGNLLGRYIPVDSLIDTLLDSARKERDRLQAELDWYHQLPLTPEQEAQLNDYLQSNQPTEPEDEVEEMRYESPHTSLHFTHPSISDSAVHKLQSNQPTEPEDEVEEMRYESPHTSLHFTHPSISDSAVHKYPDSRNKKEPEFDYAHTTYSLTSSEHTSQPSAEQGTVVTSDKEGDTKQAELGSRRSPKSQRSSRDVSPSLCYQLEHVDHHFLETAGQEDLKAMLIRKEAEIVSLSCDFEAKQQECEEHLAYIDALLLENRDLKQNMAGKQEEPSVAVEKDSKKHNQLLGTHTEGEVEGLRRTVKTLEEEVQRLREVNKERASLKEELLTARKDVIKSQLECSRLQEELDRKKEAIATLEDGKVEKAALEGRLYSVTAERDALKKHLEDQASVNVAFQELAFKTREYDAVRTERDVLRMRIQDFADLEQDIEMYKYRAREAEVLRIERDRLKERLDNLATVQVAYLTEREKNNRLVMVEAERDHLKAISFLAKCCAWKPLVTSLLYPPLKARLDELGKLELENTELRHQVESLKELVADRNRLASDIQDQEDHIKKLLNTLEGLAEAKVLVGITAESHKLLPHFALGASYEGLIYSNMMAERLQKTVSGLRQEAEEKDRQLMELQDGVDARKAVMAGLEAEVRTLKDELGASIEDVQQEREVLTKECARRATLEDELRTALSQLTKENARLKEEHDRLEAEREQWLKDLMQTQGEHISKLQEENDKLREVNVQLQEVNAQLEEEFAQHRSSFQEVEESSSHLEEDLSAKQFQSQDNNIEMETRLSNLEQMLSRSKEESERLRQSLDQLTLDNELVNKLLKEKQEQIDFLHEHVGSREKLNNLTNISQVIHRLSEDKRLSVGELEDSALDFARTINRLQELEDENKLLKEAYNKLLEQDNRNTEETKRFSEALHLAENDVKALKKERDWWTTELHAAQDIISGLNKQIEVAMLTKVEDSKKLNSEIEVLKEALQQREMDLLDLQGKMEERPTSSQLALVQANVDDLQKQLQEAEAEMTRLHETNQNVQQVVDALTEEVTELHSQMVASKEDWQQREKSYYEDYEKQALANKQLQNELDGLKEELTLALESVENATSIPKVALSELKEKLGELCLLESTGIPIQELKALVDSVILSLERVFEDLTDHFNRDRDLEQHVKELEEAHSQIGVLQQQLQEANNVTMATESGREELLKELKNVFEDKEILASELDHLKARLVDLSQETKLELMNEKETSKNTEELLNRVSKELEEEKKIRENLEKYLEKTMTDSYDSSKAQTALMEQYCDDLKNTKAALEEELNKVKYLTGQLAETATKISTMENDLERTKAAYEEEKNIVEEMSQEFAKMDSTLHTIRAELRNTVADMERERKSNNSLLNQIAESEIRLQTMKSSVEEVLTRESEVKASLSFRLEESEKLRDQLERELEQEKREQQNLLNRLSTKDSMLQADELDQELDATRREVYALKQSHKQQIELLAQEVEKLRINLNKVQADLISTKERCNVSQEALIRLESENHELKDEVATKDSIVCQLQEELSILKRKIEDLKVAKDLMEVELDELNELIAKHRSDVAEMTHRLQKQVEEEEEFIVALTKPDDPLMSPLEKLPSLQRRPKDIVVKLVVDKLSEEERAEYSNRRLTPPTYRYISKADENKPIEHEQDNSSDTETKPMFAVGMTYKLKKTSSDLMLKNTILDKPEREKLSDYVSEEKHPSKTPSSDMLSKDEEILDKTTQQYADEISKLKSLERDNKDKFELAQKHNKPLEIVDKLSSIPDPEKHKQLEDKIASMPDPKMDTEIEDKISSVIDPEDYKKLQDVYEKEKENQKVAKEIMEKEIKELKKLLSDPERYKELEDKLASMPDPKIYKEMEDKLFSMLDPEEYKKLQDAYEQEKENHKLTKEIMEKEIIELKKLLSDPERYKELEDKLASMPDPKMYKELEDILSSMPDPEEYKKLQDAYEQEKENHKVDKEIMEKEIKELKKLLSDPERYKELEDKTCFHA
uniref:Uncharacterized protein n=1 Tax=Timema cristinae TaxID=61476 RepID=A0A7R9GYJ3_TIMCR|nr:unnamed protein product [Timema cristinae]